MDQPYFSHRIRVSFADTDAAGIAHFSRMLCWVEEAEVALWAELGFALHPASSAGLTVLVGWPRAGLEVRYRQPALFDQVIGVRLRPVELRGKLLVWAFEAWCGEALVFDGKMPVVAVVRNETREIQSVAVPEAMAEALRARFGDFQS